MQVALLNNKGLQAAYAQVGISAAEVWQQALPENPKISIGVLGINAPGFGAWRSLEGLLASNLLRLLTSEKRMAIADAEFQVAQLRAIEETLRVANLTRRAWIKAVAAFEVVIHLNQAQQAADAASELAQKLGESGALAKAGQAREHAFFAELTGQKAKARLAAQLAKEELARAMGLWGDQLNFFVPDYLPKLPPKTGTPAEIEAVALANRVDLQIAKLELETLAQRYGLTQATRYVTDLGLLAGIEREKEIDTEYELVGGNLEETTKRSKVNTGIVEVDFAIPIFDSGEARLRKAELAYRQAANVLAQKAVDIRSQARSSLFAVKATHDIARHYRNSVLPLRVVIEEEGLLTYNGMITNTFELLADTRARIATVLMSGEALRDYWIAEADLAAAVIGGGDGTSAQTASAVAVEGGQPAH
ncbi:MAG: TolC family protein [Nitratireductor sp.]